MPFCDVGKYKRSKASVADGPEVTQPNAEESVKIFYQRYGSGDTKILFIIGLAGAHQSWGPQVLALAGTDLPNGRQESEVVELDNDQPSEIHGTSPIHTTEINKDELESRNQTGNGTENGTENGTGNGIEVCTFDNRGVGRSSIPEPRSEYSTQIMAEDALALLDHLGWEKAHVCGHSMGGMISTKLAAMAPHRLASLTLIGVTGGGYQCLPKFNRRSASLLYRIYRAKTPEERSAVDLETHFTDEYLETEVGPTSRRALLFKDYVGNLMSGGMQPRYGLEGQVYACWHHSLSDEQLETIRSAGIIVALIHGREDVIAQVEHARKLAKKLQPVSRMIELNGGHLITHSNTDEVNAVLFGVIRAVRMNVQCTEFKASDAGMYSMEDADHWQTGNAPTPSSGRAKDPEGVLPSAEGVWAYLPSSTSIVPEWLDVEYIFPSANWGSVSLGIQDLRRRYSPI